MSQNVRPAGRPLMPREGVRIGTFVKTASPQIVEALGFSRLDFAVVDAEHAPFDRERLDTMMIASFAVGLPLIVRIPEISASQALSCLDIGAAGLLVPHVDDAETARTVVNLSRHRGGSRGFSGSPRFARYGTLTMSGALDAGESNWIMCQIESTRAVENAEAIASVDGVDGIFIGYADLALSMGLESPQHPQVTEAAARVIAAGRASGKSVGMFVANVAERDRFRELGVDWFVIGSDQSLLRTAADAVAFA